MKLIGSDDAHPEVDDNTATFDDLTPVADSVTLEARDAGLKETVTLDAAPVAPVVLRYNLIVSAGLTPVLTANTVEFRDTSGNVPFVMPAPNMLDSELPEAAYSEAVTYDLAPQTGSWRLTVTPDMTWLSDAARVYPVLIDPSVGKYDQKDCWIRDDMSGASYCGDNYIFAGAAAGSTRRGLLDFGVDSIPAGAHIDYSQLNLLLDSGFTNGSAAGTAYGLFQPNERWAIGVNWNQSGIKPWSNGGSSGAQLSSTHPVIDGQTPTRWINWEITSTVANWKNGTLDNRGLMVRSENEGRSKQIRFVAKENSVDYWRPFIEVYYTDEGYVDPAPETPYVPDSTDPDHDTGAGPSNPREGDIEFVRFGSGAKVQVTDNVYGKVTDYHAVPGWLVGKAIMYAVHAV